LTLSRGGTSRTNEPSEVGLRAGENEIEAEGVVIRFGEARAELGGVQDDAGPQAEAIFLI
jgi:hypothetical protein